MSPEEKAAAKAEKENAMLLNKQAKADFEAECQVNKLLLLGAGESGKSTLFKQMINIYGTGYPEEERKSFEAIIYNNIIVTMQALVVNVEPIGGKIECAESAKFLREIPADSGIDASNVEHFKSLWADPGIQLAYENRSKFQLYDSASYFFERIDEVASDAYLPSHQDVLRARVRTTGIVENTFEIESNKFRMFDVGGQRNERKKWIHCFEGVTAVLFVGVLSEYDLVLYEDETVNRMSETLELFREVCNNKWFKETSMILFLNKRDLFQEKIQKVPLTVCPVFANYTGENTYDACVLAIEEAFQMKNASTEKQIYIHTTCATDTENVNAVFNAVKDIIIRKSLGEAGLV